jgi:hypothetical protein
MRVRSKKNPASRISGSSTWTEKGAEATAEALAEGLSEGVGLVQPSVEGEVGVFTTRGIPDFLIARPCPEGGIDLEVIDPKASRVVRPEHRLQIAVYSWRSGRWLRRRNSLSAQATASDPDFVTSEAKFLLNVNRLNVAFSRPRKKLIVISSSTIFRLLPPDMETFENAPLWKQKC